MNTTQAPKAHYHDHEGFSKVGEVVYGQIKRYYREDPHTHVRRQWGFAKLANGTEIFIHRNCMFRMRTFGIGGAEFIPDFTNIWGGSDSLTEPKDGDPIVGIVGNDRKGRPCLIAWSHKRNYEQALKSCEVYRELELERYERDPSFRCMESIHVLGRPGTTPRAIFEGTKRDFGRKYSGPYNSIAGRPDPLRTQIVGDAEYIRWFERMTVNGWERCDDPRKMKFKLTRYDARDLLFAQDTVRNFNATETTEWTSGSPDLVIAYGKIEDDVKVIVFPETPFHLETRFEGQAAEEFWKIGLKAIKIADGITVRELAAKLNVRIKDVLAKLLVRRIMMTINSTMEFDLARDIASEFEFQASKADTIPDANRYPTSR